MKARLLHRDETLTLLFCTGKIQIVSLSEAREFLLHFDNPTYYSGPEKWNHENLTLESYRGNTIATVTDGGVLQVSNAEYLRKILSAGEIKYITVSEFAAMHGKKPAIVRRFCSQNRIAGVMQKGNTWLIPENSPYPADERSRNK